MPEAMIAETAAREWKTDDLFELVRKAHRDGFDAQRLEGRFFADARP